MLILLFALLASQARADIDVAFLQKHDAQGNLVRLEPDGRFYHLAIAVHGRWLHAHPFRGVELATRAQLEEVADIAEIVHSPLPSPSDDDIARFLGKRYDGEFNWSDEKIYCSELVAKLLGFAPRPMHFDRKLWPESYWRLEGLPGISPDEVYRRLTESQAPTRMTR